MRAKKVTLLPKTLKYDGSIRPPNSTVPFSVPSLFQSVGRSPPLPSESAEKNIEPPEPIKHVFLE